jgi:syntaxin 8
MVGRKKKSFPNVGNQFDYLKSLILKSSGIPTSRLVSHTDLRSSLFSTAGTRKTVRFSESNTYQTPPSRPSDDFTSSGILSHQQQIMLDQDDSLDRLSDSIGRQRELSIQIGDELDSQGELLDDVDGMVDRSRSRLDGARRRLDRFSKKAKDNGMQRSVLY